MVTRCEERRCHWHRFPHGAHPAAARSLLVSPEALQGVSTRGWRRGATAGDPTLSFRRLRFFATTARKSATSSSGIITVLIRPRLHDSGVCTRPRSPRFVARPAALASGRADPGGGCLEIRRFPPIEGRRDLQCEDGNDRLLAAVLVIRSKPSAADEGSVEALPIAWRLNGPPVHPFCGAAKSRTLRHRYTVNAPRSKELPLLSLLLSRPGELLRWNVLTASRAGRTTVVPNDCRSARVHRSPPASPPDYVSGHEGHR